MNREQWNQVEELYHAALEQPAEHRADFLRSACTDEALRREVESLLASDRADDTVLDHPAWERQLSPGERIGPYEVLSRIGAGGMGEVWKARDTRLGRDVALKVCASRFSDRFQREAHAIAALNHPHVCTLFDVGADCLVMEYVEGKPIQGPLPLDQVLQFGAQIADALSAAHRKGIIHRDLKPANILLTGRAGHQGVKVLDFGLAKIDRARSEGDGATASLTESREGRVLGTLQYMSPEQLQGKAVDARSDIFSFGCVLYELLTGRRAFEGTDSASITAAILKEEPPPLTAPLAPGALTRVMNKCLAKEPDDRWQTASDLRDELLWIASGGSNFVRRGYPSSAEEEPARSPIAAGAAPVSNAENRRPTRRGIVIAAAATVAAAAPVIFGVRAWLAPKSVTITLGQLGSDAVISPDGVSIVYGDLVVHRLDAPPTLGPDDIRHDTSLPKHDPRSSSPVWSPDGSQILFYNDISGLWRTPLPNGPPTSIQPTLGITRGFAWGPDGAVLGAVVSSGYGLYLTNVDGSKPKRLDVPGLPSGVSFWPEFLPDGKNILFGWWAFGELQVGTYLATLSGGRIVRGPFLLEKDLTVGHYSPARGGMLLYVSGDTLFADRLDVRRGKLEGKPRKIVDSVYSEPNLFRAAFSVSRNGVLAWRAGHASLARLTWFDRRGRVLGTTGPPCLPNWVLLSPDESRILFFTPIDNAGFNIAETGRAGFFPLPGVVAPRWLPGSTDIVYRKREAAGFRILQRAPAGGPERELTLIPSDSELHDISFDGRYLLIARTGDGTKSLYTVRLDAGSQPAKPEFFAHGLQGKFAPDGRWIVYAAAADGHIHAQPFPLHGPPVQIDENGGTAPVWRGDGKEILYLSQGTVYAVSVAIRGGSIHPGPAQALFKVLTPGGLNGASCPLAVTRNGERILFAQGTQQPNPQLWYAMTAWDSRLH